MKDLKLPVTRQGSTDYPQTPSDWGSQSAELWATLNNGPDGPGIHERWIFKWKSLKTIQKAIPFENAFSKMQFLLFYILIENTIWSCGQLQVRFIARHVKGYYGALQRKRFNLLLMTSYMMIHNWWEHHLLRHKIWHRLSETFDGIINWKRLQARTTM